MEMNLRTRLEIELGDSGQIGYKTSFTGLTAGIYTLVISENITTNSPNIIYVCAKTFTETFEITQPPPIVATITPSDYNGFGVKLRMIAMEL